MIHYTARIFQVVARSRLRLQFCLLLALFVERRVISRADARRVRSARSCTDIASRFDSQAAEGHRSRHLRELPQPLPAGLSRVRNYFWRQRSRPIRRSPACSNCSGSFRTAASSWSFAPDKLGANVKVSNLEQMLATARYRTSDRQRQRHSRGARLSLPRDGPARGPAGGHGHVPVPRSRRAHARLASGVAGHQHRFLRRRAGGAATGRRATLRPRFDPGVSPPPISTASVDSTPSSTTSPTTTNSAAASPISACRLCSPTLSSRRIFPPTTCEDFYRINYAGHAAFATRARADTSAW